MSIESKVKRLVRTAIGDSAFANFVSGLGTSRDKAAHSFYVAGKRKSVGELNTVYQGDWIAQRVINKPAQDAISGGWYLGKVTSDQNQSIIDMSKKLKLNKRLLKAMVLARLHGWSFILIGSNDGVDLTEPLDIGVDELEFLTVLKRDKLKPKADGQYLLANMAGGDYESPEFYQMGDDYNPTYVHNTRVIRIDAPDLVGGDDGLPMPVLQNIYDALVRNTSVQANAGSLVYEAKIDVVKVENLNSDLEINGNNTIKALYNKFTSLAAMKGNNGMMVLDASDEYDSKSYSFAGLSDMMREFSTQAAGAAEMPRSLLFGESPNGLGGTGDFELKSYYKTVSTMQVNVLQEPLEYLLSLIILSLGYPLQDLGLTFNPLWQLDEKTRSEVEKSNAERDEIYLERGIITEAQIARQLVDDGTYTVIDDAHIKLLDSIVGADYGLES